VAGVLTEHAFVEILEGRFTVSVSGSDPVPVVVAALAGSPLREPFELAGGIPSVVPTVATAALPLVLEVALERTRE